MEPIINVNIHKHPFPRLNSRAIVDNSYINAGKSSKDGRKLLTYSIDTGVGIALISSFLYKLYHIDPNLETPSKIIKTLARDIEEMRNIRNNSEPQIAIIGGLNPTLYDTESEKSRSIYCAAAEILDNEGLNGIMLCGKKRGASKEDFRTNGRGIDIYISDFEAQNATPEDVAAALKNRYATVEQHGDFNFNVIV